MNPANFQQAMMAGQGMQQAGGGAVIAGNVRATMLERFRAHQQQGMAGNGWQAMFPPMERVNLVTQLATSFQLANPTSTNDHATKSALAYETQVFTQARSKEQYATSIQQQLRQHTIKRQQQSQMGLGQMGPQGNNMPGAMAQPMQQNMSNQGNQMGQQFNAQLGRPMQVSPLGMNMQQPQLQGSPMNAAMPNQNQGMPMQQQQPMGNPANNPELQEVIRLTMRMAQQANDETKGQILRRYQAMDPQTQNMLRSRYGDPLKAHFFPIAQKLFQQQRMQAQSNGVANGMMNQQNPMMQRQQPDANVDISQLINQVTGQQQDAMRSADSGQLVVPASNNPMLNQGLNNNMPIGLNAGQMHNPGMNPQMQMHNVMQQQRQGMNPQQAAAIRIAQQNQALQRQAQAGQNNQQNQMTPQMSMMNGQSPMPQANQLNVPLNQQQPMGTPQQRPLPSPAAPMPNQQNRPQPAPRLVDAMKALGAQQQAGQRPPIRRPLPQNLPASIPQQFRLLLQTTDDETFKLALDYLSKTNGNQGNNTNPQMNQGQQGQAMNNQLMGGAQQNAQLNVQAMNQLRNQQQPLRVQPNGQNPMMPNGQMGQVPGLTPELLAGLDKRPFPRSLLAANNAPMIPDHIQTFMQLKEFISQPQNQGIIGNLNTQMVTTYQLRAFQAERRNQMQAKNGGNMQMGGNMQNGAGPAPTAPMVPPGALNNLGQQQQQPQQRPGMGMGGVQIPPQLRAQLQNVVATPQDMQQARAMGKFPPTMSDDELRLTIVKMKQSEFLRKWQMQNGMAMQQRAGQAPMMAPNMQQNQMPQPPQQPRPPMAGAQTPQMPVQTPNNQPKQTQNRPAQQQNANKTPQQTNNKLKRPPPDEVIEIFDNAPPAMQAPQMQATKSQQAQNDGSDQTTQAQKQLQQERLGALLKDVRAEHKPNPQVTLTNEERQALAAKINEAKQFITRAEWAIRWFFVGAMGMQGTEETTKNYLRYFMHLADNVNFKEATLLPNPTIKADAFDKLIMPFKQLVMKIMQNKKMQQEQSQGGMPSGPVQTAQQASAKAAAGQPQQLNAANLDQHNSNLRQAAATQGHRRSSSKAHQAPPAPTAGPGQMAFNFNNVSSPQGVPKYGEGAMNLTADKLNLPSKKKQKKDGQPPSGTSTPAQPSVSVTASPQIGKPTSPEIKRQPAPEQQVQQQPKHFCRDPNCEYSRKGFETMEQLSMHMQQDHAPPKDAVKYVLENLATVVGLNADGTTKAEKAPNSGGKSSVLAKNAASNTAKLANKGSPGLDKQKGPQQPGKVGGPTSVGVQSESASKTNGKGTNPNGTLGMDLGTDFDPWKDSEIQQGEFQEWFTQYDTLTGDWGKDRVLRSPQLTPATTPDTNVTDKTAATRDSEVLEGDAVNMTLAMQPDAGFTTWKDINGSIEPSIMDSDLMHDMATIGIDENMLLGGFDDNTNVNDWMAMFGSGSNIDGNKIPGWEDGDGEMLY